jgi:uncharacterized delta-60 repeat protein
MTAIGSRAVAFAVALQRDGKIVVAGASESGPRVEIAVARYRANGSLDPTFGLDGVVKTPLGDAYAGAYAAAIQPDGKIVVAGSTEFYFALARYNPNGSLDPTFGMGGTVTTAVGGPRDRATAVALQPDGKLVVAGRAGDYEAAVFAVARYKPDGSLDMGFGQGGIVTASLEGYDEGQALAVQADGKLLVAGESGDPIGRRPWNFALLRYGPDGQPDPGFGTRSPGVTTTPIGSSSIGRAIAVLPAGRIVVVGEALKGGKLVFALAEYDRRGSLDLKFGHGGTLTTSLSTGSDAAYAVAAQRDGKIIAAGTADQNAAGGSSFGLVRYLGRLYCVTPSVLGWPLARAKLVIARAHCKVGRIARRISAKVRAGRVIAQSPGPGVRRPLSARVNLVVSKGDRSR